MSSKAKWIVASVLIFLGADAMVAAKPATQNVSRPLLLAKDHYNCLIKYADKLAVSARGNLVNISRCPPQIEVGFTPPVKLMKNYLVLTPDDLQCFVQARQRGQRIAYKRGQSRVAVYLRPCGIRK